MGVNRALFLFNSRRGLCEETEIVASDMHAMLPARARKDSRPHWLDTADADHASEHDDFLRTLVSVAGKARSLSQPHHGRAATGFVASE